MAISLSWATRHFARLSTRAFIRNALCTDVSIVMRHDKKKHRLEMPRNDVPTTLSAFDRYTCFVPSFIVFFCLSRPFSFSAISSSSLRVFLSLFLLSRLFSVRPPSFNCSSMIVCRSASVFVLVAVYVGVLVVVHACVCSCLLTVLWLKVNFVKSSETHSAVWINRYAVTASAQKFFATNKYNVQRVINADEQHVHHRLNSTIFCDQKFNLFRLERKKHKQKEYFPLKIHRR